MREEYVGILVEQWRSTVSLEGFQNARKTFLGAKHSLTGRSSTPLQTRRDLMEVYRRVESEVFGAIQEVPGEREMLGYSSPPSNTDCWETPDDHEPMNVEKDLMRLLGFNRLRDLEEYLNKPMPPEVVAQFEDEEPDWNEDDESEDDTERGLKT
jgi:hypothetical protein